MQTTTLNPRDCTGIPGPTYTAYNGAKLAILCGQELSIDPSAIIDSYPVADYASCLDACAAIPECMSVDFFESDNYCLRMSNIGTPDSQYPAMDAGYKVA